MSRPKILLADDHRILAEGLRCLLANDFEVVGIVEDGRSLISEAMTLKPDVIVAEISMPHLNGIAAIPILRRQDPHVRIVILTMHQDRSYARRGLKAGAHGFVLKHSAADELVLAINAALKGHMFITPSLTTAVLRSARQGTREGQRAGRTVTPRQREILQLLAEGNSVREIAMVLAISPRTVEMHKYKLMKLYDIHSNAELLHFAIKHGIVKFSRKS